MIDIEEPLMDWFFSLLPYNSAQRQEWQRLEWRRFPLCNLHAYFCPASCDISDSGHRLLALSLMSDV